MSYRKLALNNDDMNSCAKVEGSLRSTKRKKEIFTETTQTRVCLGFFPLSNSLRRIKCVERTKRH